MTSGVLFLLAAVIGIASTFFIGGACQAFQSGEMPAGRRLARVGEALIFLALIVAFLAGRWSL